MGAEWFSRVFAVSQRRRILVLGLLLIVLGFAGGAFFLLPFENTLDAMLPEGSTAQRMLQAMQDARFAGKAVISLEARGPDVTRADLIAAVDRLAGAIDSPLITRVLADFSNTTMLEDLVFFFRHLPQILDARSLAALDARLAPAEVDQQLRRRYLQLLKPEGSFLGGAIRADPLDFQAVLRDRIAGLTAAFGYRVTLENGHLLSADGRHALLILDTGVSLTDSRRARQLIDYLQARLRDLPPAIAGEIICGHQHTLSNEKTVKRDIALTNTVATAIFIVMFFLCFRDVRAVLAITLIPIVAVVIAIPLTYALVGTLSLLVIGMGSVIAGVAVDYAIHIYVAVRRGEDTGAAVRQIALPVSLGAVTTMCMFAGFLSSHIRGYHQLAWFSILSLALALGCAFFIFPHFCCRRRAEREAREESPAAPSPSRSWNRNLSLAWLATMLIGLPLAWWVPFDSRIARLDGTEKPILQAEDRFRQVWGDGATGRVFLVVTGPDYETVLEANDRLYAAAAGRIASNRFTSLAALWPARRTRAANAARWEQFWQDGREARLRQALAEKGAQSGFAADAFAPFLAQLPATNGVAAEPFDNALLDRFKEQFVQRTKTGWQAISFFPDTPDNLRAVEPIVAREPGVLLVSAQTMAAQLSAVYTAEITRVSAVAVALIVLVMATLLRNLRLTFIALVPPLTAVVWLLAAMALCRLTLNVANLIAGIVVFGLSLDYGFIMMHSYRHRLRAGTKTSVHISAITTVVGTAALLFAQHPALFSIGFTLTIGITAGYVAAMLVVPALYGLLVPRAPEEDAP